MSKQQSKISIALLIGAPLSVLLIWTMELSASMSLFTHPIADRKKIATDNPSPTDLASHLGIRKQAPSICKNNLKDVKVWVSPYRPFPEIWSQGLWMSRGLGDYEYLTLLRVDPCMKLRANYGAFKYSPAHKAFEKAHSQGIAAEMLAAINYKFDSFALDLNKVWVADDEFRLKCKSQPGCSITTDNFVLISLKDKKAVSAISQALLRIRPKHQHPNSFQEFFLKLTGISASEWWPLEISTDGKTIWSWSKEFGTNRSFSLAGKQLAGIPENLEVILRPAPSVEKLEVVLKCSNRQEDQVLTINKAISISSKMRGCQPESVEITSFSTMNRVSKTLGNPIPPLGPKDNRHSLFALEASQ